MSAVTVVVISSMVAAALVVAVFGWSLAIIAATQFGDEAGVDIGDIGPVLSDHDLLERLDSRW